MKHVCGCVTKSHPTEDDAVVFEVMCEEHRLNGKWRWVGLKHKDDD